MLEVKMSWDWFHADLSLEEETAIKEGRLCAIVQEDGDNHTAYIEAVKSINAPAEDTRLASYNPCIGDCILVVAWDSRSVNCESEDEDEDDWTF